MGFQCGIVGLPNVGKSTLFNALTQAKVPAENYPFCTIDPNIRNVNVSDRRLLQLAKIIPSAEIIPTTIQFVDIAGLVKGAAMHGEGLGNKFLAHIRETDAIAHVVRCFENENITHVSGAVDPIDDIQTIQTELALKDLETINNAITKARQAAKNGHKEAQNELQVLNKVEEHLNQNGMVRTLTLSESEQNIVANLHLITSKPMFYVANHAEGKEKNSKLLSQIEDYAANQQCSVIPICAALEAELAQLDENERIEFLQTLDMAESGLDQVIQVGYKLLNLLTFFTIGPKEARAWTVTRGAKAPQAAGRIHTDFAKGFIRAEIISCDDYIQYGGEAGARDAGRLRVEGRDYVMQDGDVVHFRFNVSK